MAKKSGEGELEYILLWLVLVAVLSLSLLTLLPYLLRFVFALLVLPPVFELMFMLLKMDLKSTFFCEPDREAWT